MSSTAEGNCARPAQDQQAELAARAAAAGSNGGEAGFRASAALEREDRDDTDSIFGGDGDAEGPTANDVPREVSQMWIMPFLPGVCELSPLEYLCAI